MLKTRKASVLAVIISALMTSVAGIAQAQMLMVNPLVIQTQARGSQGNSTIEFTNTGSEAFRGRVYSNPFTYGREGFKSLPSSPNDLTPHLRFSPREFVLQPNQARTVRLNARFDPSVPDGEYRALMFLEPLNEINPANPGSNVAVRTRLGITVYMLKGDVLPQLKVEQASYHPELRQIRLLVSNAGKASGRPRTTWSLTQENQKISSGKLDQITVIAEGDRYLNISYPPQGVALKAGKYQLSGQLDWSFPQTGSLDFTVPLTITEQDVDKLKQIEKNKN